MSYPFTEAEFRKANKDWGANCGPAALAFALNVGINAVRNSIPLFDDRRYTNPNMMHAALETHRQNWRQLRPEESSLFDAANPALVRVQWGGPWMAKDAPPKWRYRQTHWICTWLRVPSRLHAIPDPIPHVFDCNCGIVPFERWKTDVVPLITRGVDRADGTWSYTHVWRLCP